MAHSTIGVQIPPRNEKAPDHGMAVPYVAEGIEGTQSQVEGTLMPRTLDQTTDKIEIGDQA